MNNVLLKLFGADADPNLIATGCSQGKISVWQILLMIVSLLLLRLLRPDITPILSLNIFPGIKPKFSFGGQIPLSKGQLELMLPLCRYCHLLFNWYPGVYSTTLNCVSIEANNDLSVFASGFPEQCEHFTSKSTRIGTKRVTQSWKYSF